MPAVLVNNVQFAHARWQVKAVMETDVGILSDVGARLRKERERLRLNQEDFGSFAGVTRNSQQTYEAGRRPFPISYLLALQQHQVDAVYILTGMRSAQVLHEKQEQILSAFNSLNRANQGAILQLSCSLAGLPTPAAAAVLPSTAALEDALAGFFQGSPDLSGDELVRELAMSLPTILRGAEDEIDDHQLDQSDTVPSQRVTGDAGHRVARRGLRS